MILTQGNFEDDDIWVGTDKDIDMVKRADTYFEEGGEDYYDKTKV